LFDNFFGIFNDIFIKGEAYKLILDGLVYTLIIAIFAVLIGIILGALLAICKVVPQKNIIAKFFNGVANVYITIIRGTPVMVQLLLFYFGVFAGVMRGYEYKALFIAILVFGINSSAYVAEIIRSGILSIDKGQMEAGRSLGFTYSQTMLKIILPQAIKNILPALGNEFIVMIKETSVAGFITVFDLTRATRSIVAEYHIPFVPYFTLAIVYLVLVMIFTFFLNLLEKRLRKSDH
jgi:His/Glu/Gln/Arg/opine family amino acid ABC transporter permease subunit